MLFINKRTWNPTTSTLWWFWQQHWDCENYNGGGAGMHHEPIRTNSGQCPGRLALLWSLLNTHSIIFRLWLLLLLHYNKITLFFMLILPFLGSAFLIKLKHANATASSTQQSQPLIMLHHFLNIWPFDLQNTFILFTCFTTTKLTVSIDSPAFIFMQCAGMSQIFYNHLLLLLDSWGLSHSIKCTQNGL